METPPETETTAPKPTSAAAPTTSHIWPPPPPLRTLDDILGRAVSHLVYIPLLPSPPPSAPTLADFPLLTKQHLLTTLNPLLKGPFIHGTYLSPSGGTISLLNVLYVPTDTTENLIHRYLFGKLLAETGTVEPSTIAVNLHGGAIMYRDGDLTKALIDFGGGTEIPATKHATPEEALRIAKQFGADGLWGEGSKLVEIAAWAEKNGMGPDDFSLKTGVFTSSPLSAQQEEYVRRILGFRTIASILGSAECGPIGVCPPATEISEGLKRVFVVDRKMLVIEIMDTAEKSDNSKPGRVLASSLGELPSQRTRAPTGELVLTSLVRFRNPIVRFSTGDFGRIFAHPSNPDWFQLEFHGRDLSKSFDIHGEYINLDDIERLVFAADAGRGILQWQIIIVDENVEYRVVLDKEGALNAEERLAKLRKAIQKEIMAWAPFTVTAVEYDDLERGKMARKIRKVVDRRVASP